MPSAFSNALAEAASWSAQAALPGYQEELNAYLPWLIGGALIVYVVFLVGSKLLKGKRPGLERASAGLNFDQMKKTGLLTPEELKAVQRKMVGGIAGNLARDGSADGNARGLIAVAATVEPETIGSFLTPEELAASERARRLREEVERSGGATRFNKYLDPGLRGDAPVAGATERGGPSARVASSAASASPDIEREEGGSPVGASAHVAAEELPPAPRVSPDSPFARIDGMLQAGVITAAEHAEMKAHYERKARSAKQ